MATNGSIIPAPLNRVRASVIIQSNTALNVTAAYMTKKLLSVDFDEDFVDQIQTATNVINSPAPYVMGTVSIGVIRTLPLAQAFINQAQATAVLGTVNVHSDTSQFSAIQLVNCSLIRPQPGSFDGMSGELDVVIRGVYYINNNLWQLT